MTQHISTNENQRTEVPKAELTIEGGITMEEEKSEQLPVIDEYKGKPILRIPIVDAPDPGTSWHWLTFGKNKAKAIVKHFEAIKKFSETE